MVDRGVEETVTSRGGRWSPEEKDALKREWAKTPSIRAVATRLGLTIGQVAGQAMRLNLHFALPDGEPMKLSPSHPAMLEMRTIFPTRIRDVRPGIPILKSGRDSRKLGVAVEKGPWRGMPIYSLTLEERATCPASCHLLGSCYGNALNFSIRYRHGPKLERRLEEEVATLQTRHPQGFVVRLHILGDFMSVGYVRLWDRLLMTYPALRCFGYTARDRDSAIGREIRKIPWYRFAIRFSTELVGARNAVAIPKAALETVAPRKEIVVCPVETGKTRSCATCGLCWSTAALDKTIAFIMHGNPGPRARRPRGEAS